MKFIAGISLLFLFNIVSAQNLLMHDLPQETPQIGLRYLRPVLEPDPGLTVFSGVYDLSANIPVNAQINLVGSVPVSTFDADNESGKTALGDIYIGVQFRGKSSHLVKTATTFGVFLPTAGTEGSAANSFGITSNFTELQKYLPDIVTIYMNYGYHRAAPGEVMFGYEIGPTVLVPTEEAVDPEIYMHYGLKGGYQTTRLAFSVEFTGIVIITEDVGDLGDRFVNALALGAQLTGGRFRPGLFFKLYLDEDLSDFVDGVMGVNLEVSIK